jgi:hypothetical protein
MFYYHIITLLHASFASRIACLLVIKACKPILETSDAETCFGTSNDHQYERALALLVITITYKKNL